MVQNASFFTQTTRQNIIPSERTTDSFKQVSNEASGETQTTPENMLFFSDTQS